MLKKKQKTKQRKAEIKAEAKFVMFGQHHGSDDTDFGRLQRWRAPARSTQQTGETFIDFKLRI